MRAFHLATLLGIGLALGGHARLLAADSVPAPALFDNPVIAKGKCTPAGLEAITARMHAGLAAAGAQLDGVYYCLHHPDAALDQYRVACDCRKPRPGLLRLAAEEHGVDLAASVMIGDGLNDVQAGRAAGCLTILIAREKCELCRKMEELGVRPDAIAPDLAATVRLLGSRIGRKGEENADFS